MTSLSVLLRRRQPLWAALVTACALTACAADPAVTPPATANVSGPHGKCSAPPPIPDIWKLEPMLTKQGLLTAEMSREQKEAAIRDYIQKKNQAFLNCQDKK